MPFFFGPANICTEYVCMKILDVEQTGVVDMLRHDRVWDDQEPVRSHKRRS